MWKRIITLTVLFCMALSLSAPALAYKHYSMEKREKESHLPYTFGDLAAARLAVYGILDERFRTPQPETAEPLSRLDAVKLLWNAFAEEAAPDNNGGKRDAADDGGDYHSTARAVMGAFSDVPAEFTGQVSWAYQNDIVESITDTEFGVCPASETAFVSMLLNAMGYQGQYESPCALPFAASIGLTPLGLSASFTLGDAALYLQAAMDLQTADGVPVRERMNIPAKPEQATFPDIVRLTPLSPEDMEPQLREATRCLPQTVEISGEFLTKADLIGFFNRFYDAAGENWYTVRIADEYPPDITMDVLCCEDLPREEWEEFDAVMDRLKKEWRTGALDDLDYMAQTDLECASRLCSGRGLTVRFFYNEAWELVCDLDDAFTLYADDSITKRADTWYHARLDGAESDVEKVYAAKHAVTCRAVYASPVGRDELGPYYAPEAHSILGFFNGGRIVCDGYASVFQYLMLRAGLDCVVVYGSTVSQQDAEDGGGNHAWNKVKVDGVWLNEDVCWSDTGWFNTFDLKTDVFYREHRHWTTMYRCL